MQLGPWLPDSMLFAAKWSLPTLMLGIGLPLWFRQVTGSLRWGYLAAFLTIVAPASMWWSGRPVNTLGFTFAGCALGIYAAERLTQRHTVRFMGSVVLAGILLARLPSYYQPLAIVLGLPVVLATAAFLIAGSQARRTRLIALGSLALSGAVWTGALLFENRDAIRAGLGTVYPGERKSTGTAHLIGRVFGATDLGFLKTTEADLVATNASEIATSFTVLMFVLVVLVSRHRWGHTAAASAAFWSLFGCALFWLSWCTVNYGDVGLKLPLANLVPSFRAANGVGFLAVLAFAMFMTQWRNDGWSTPAVTGLATAFVSAWAGSSLQQNFMPLLSLRMIWLSALVAGLVVFGLVRWPRRLAPLVLAGLAAALMTFRAAPIEVGLADLRDSQTAQQFLKAGQACGRTTTCGPATPRLSTP